MIRKVKMDEFSLLELEHPPSALRHLSLWCSGLHQRASLWPPVLWDFHHQLPYLGLETRLPDGVFWDFVGFMIVWAHSYILVCRPHWFLGVMGILKGQGGNERVQGLGRVGKEKIFKGLVSGMCSDQLLSVVRILSSQKTRKLPCPSWLHLKGMSLFVFQKELSCVIYINDCKPSRKCSKKGHTKADVAWPPCTRPCKLSPYHPASQLGITNSLDRRQYLVAILRVNTTTSWDLPSVCSHILSEDLRKTLCFQQGKEKGTIFEISTGEK